jgi:hypothetical protein
MTATWSNATIQQPIAMPGSVAELSLAFSKDIKIQKLVAHYQHV